MKKEEIAEVVRLAAAEVLAKKEEIIEDELPLPVQTLVRLFVLLQAPCQPEPHGMVAALLQVQPVAAARGVRKGPCEERGNNRGRVRFPLP